MAVNVDLIRAYTDGLVATTAYGDTSVTLPTNGTGSLSADFFEVGSISDNGITEATSQDRTDIFIWQGAALARRIPGKYTKTFKFAAAEQTLLNLGIQFPGSAVTQTAEGATVAEAPPSTDIRAWVLHGIDGARKQRIVVPQGEVTERGDVVWSSGDITVYDWTLSAYTSGGIACYRYYVDTTLAL
jgi:hypothetical protein